MLKRLWLIIAPLLAVPGIAGQGVSASTGSFLEAHCAKCHDDVERKGGLDLTALKFQPGDASNFDVWVKIHDRVIAGEMPPREKPRPPRSEVGAFVTTLAGTLMAAERATVATEGRATQRIST